MPFQDAESKTVTPGGTRIVFGVTLPAVSRTLNANSTRPVPSCDEIGGGVGASRPSRRTS